MRSSLGMLARIDEELTSELLMRDLFINVPLRQSCRAEILEILFFSKTKAFYLKIWSYFFSHRMSVFLICSKKSVAFLCPFYSAKLIHSFL